MTDDRGPSSSAPRRPRPFATEQQVDLLEALRSRHARLAQTYEGALRAFVDETNPDGLAQSAHSLRELFDALVVAADLESTKTASLGEEVARISKMWVVALDRTTSLTAAGWKGPIDTALAQLLQHLTQFFDWYQKEHPRHAAIRNTALDRLDPGRGTLPEQLRKQRGRTQNEIAKYMNEVAHHRIAPSRAEFEQRMNEAETFLRGFVKPTPLADRKTIDEILRRES